MVARTKNKATVNEYMFLLVKILLRAMKKSILLVFSDCGESERIYNLFVLYFYLQVSVYVSSHLFVLSFACPTLVVRYLRTKSLILYYIPMDT